MTTDLVPVERRRLAELEDVIDKGKQTFLEVGDALLEIRDSRLYRATHHTFEAYCQERHGWSASRGRQLIAAARTVTDVTAAGLPAPRTEAEARRLARQRRAEANPPSPQLEQHELVAGLLPDLDDEAWGPFADSIEKLGVLVPIILYEDKILDGWLRYRAALERRVEPTFMEYEGDEPFAIWHSLNLVRYHHPRGNASYA